MFTLEGLDWRSWTAADRCSVAFRLAKQQAGNDKQALIHLYELVGDRDGVAAVTREIMGQDSTIQTDR